MTAGDHAMDLVAPCVPVVWQDCDVDLPSPGLVVLCYSKSWVANRLSKDGINEGAYSPITDSWQISVWDQDKASCRSYVVENLSASAPTHWTYKPEFYEN